MDIRRRWQGILATAVFTLLLAACSGDDGSTASTGLLGSGAPTAWRFPAEGKGTAYQAFSRGYDPSTANTTAIYFGSDVARKEMGSLWGTQSYLSESCAASCRNDLATLKGMGVNLIRLYDWDPGNDHSQFLDYAQSLGIKVVVPISNWLPQNPQYWDAQVPTYFQAGNFGNSAGTDWHPAIAGVIISNELDGTGDYQNAIGLVARFLQEADSRSFDKNILVGVPVTFVPRGAPFGPNGANIASWNQFDQLLTDSRTAPYRDRLMLTTNTYNDKTDLFVNFLGTSQGWVSLTYQQFGRPILFTEIGYSRAKPDYTAAYVQDQLTGTLAYQKANPTQLLGACHFQFSDKVWKQDDPSDTEGAFGSFHHGAITLQIQTQASDFTHMQVPTPGILTIDALTPTTTYQAVVDAYK